MIGFRRVLGPSNTLARSSSIASRTSGARGCMVLISKFFDVGGSVSWKSPCHRPPETIQTSSRRMYSRFFASKSKGPASTVPTQAPPKIPSLRSRQQQTSADGFLLVYVHPLSQLVLNYFQSHCHDWIRRKKLDHRLFLHRDGTFLMESNHNHYQSVLRIWTYYDTEERKHWLAMSIHQVMHRFLLQDNTMKVWKGYKHDSIEERVHESICDLMDSIDEMD